MLSDDFDIRIAQRRAITSILGGRTSPMQILVLDRATRKIIHSLQLDLRKYGVMNILYASQLEPFIEQCKTLSMPDLNTATNTTTNNNTGTSTNKHNLSKSGDPYSTTKGLRIHSQSSIKSTRDMLRNIHLTILLTNASDLIKLAPISVYSGLFASVSAHFTSCAHYNDLSELVNALDEHQSKAFHPGRASGDAKKGFGGLRGQQQQLFQVHSLISPLMSVTGACVSFYAVEKNLISLGIHDSFSRIYDGILQADKASNSLMHVVDQLSDHLLAVFVQMELCPIFIAPQHGPCALIAATIHAKMRAVMAKHPTANQNKLRNHDQNEPVVDPSWWSNRPIMYICDRTVDMTPMLSHSWTYKALCSELLGMDEMLRVRVRDESGVMREYQLGQNDDDLWSLLKNKEFPEMAQEIEIQVASYQADCASIQASGQEGNTMRALGVMETLSRRKELLDMHTNIASALLDAIKMRKLDLLVQFESTVLQGEQTPSLAPSVDDLLQFLAQMVTENPNSSPELELDLLRTLGLYIMCLGPIWSDLNTQRIEKVLEKHGSKASEAVTFFRSLFNQSLRAMVNRDSYNLQGGAAATTKPMPTPPTVGSKREFVKGLFTGVAAKGIAGLAQVKGRVQNMINRKQIQAMSVSLVEAILDIAASAKQGNLDPQMFEGDVVSNQLSAESVLRTSATLKIATVRHVVNSIIYDCGSSEALLFRDACRSQSVASLLSSPSFQDIMLLMVGGGSFWEASEFHKMRQRRPMIKNAMYICTEFVSPIQETAQASRVFKARSLEDACSKALGGERSGLELNEDALEMLI